MTLAEAIRTDGYASVADLLAPSEVNALRADLGRDLADGQPGSRGVIARCEAIRVLAVDARIRGLIEPVLGQQAAVVRSIYFNKTPQANWQVGWHQDLTIAVRARHELAGYGPWSHKDGVAHVQAPVDLLDNMLTLRLHLDDTDEDNGALLVVPGSHTLGRLSADAALAAAQRSPSDTCRVPAGGAMLFRPLLLHASRKSVSERARRVIHLEFAAAPLQAPLAWHEWVCKADDR